MPSVEELLSVAEADTDTRNTMEVELSDTQSMEVS